MISYGMQCIGNVPNLIYEWTFKINNFEEVRFGISTIFNRNDNTLNAFDDSINIYHSLKCVLWEQRIRFNTFNAL